MKPFAMTLRALTLVLALCAASAGAHAQPKGPPAPRMQEEEGLGVPDISDEGGQPGGQFGRGRFAEQLGLTPQQREQLKALRGSRTDQEKQMLQLKLKRIELREMIEKGEASDEQILAQAEALSKATLDQNMQRIKKLLAVRKILTPEQRSKFKELIAERRESWGGRGPGENGGPGWANGPGGGFGRGDGQFRRKFGFGQ